MKSVTFSYDDGITIGQQLIMKDGKVAVEKVPYSINPMAKGMGDAYVDEFYGAFERHIPDECGKGINYFFSDELQFNVRGNLWSDDFKEEFIKRKGYDITKKWNAIFEDIGPAPPKIRLDYYDVIVQLSEERYFKPVYDWHEKRELLYSYLPMTGTQRQQIFTLVRDTRE